MAALTETQILSAVYTNIELDATDWSATSDEYLAGRRFCNQSINRWENAIVIQQGKEVPIKWRELWANLTDASDGTKTQTAGTYSYSCPTNFKSPGSYVRTVTTGGDSTIWDVVGIDRVASLVKESGYKFCYFSGNQKDGFKINFNPLITLTTGDTIKYEYYKYATTFTTTTSTTEIADPYFIVCDVTGHFLKDEDAAQSKFWFNQADARLNQMIGNNMIGLEGVAETIHSSLDDDNVGFGY